MTTFLIGGLILFTVIASIIIPTEAIKAMGETPVSSDFISLYASFALAVFSIPSGYLVNQIWMTVYNIFIDVHNKIFSDHDSLELIIEQMGEKGIGWKRGYLNEVRLALYHRKNSQIGSDQFLSWHRNRLNALHSNGSAVTGCILGLLSCFLISLTTHNITWIVHPFSQYLCERWWFIVIVFVIILFSICRMVREYKIIIIYNQMSIIDNKNKENATNTNIDSKTNNS